MGEIKRRAIEYLPFRRGIYWTFSQEPSNADTPESKLAARYLLLLQFFREAPTADERLRYFAEWIWAELGVEPKESLGESVIASLSSVRSMRHYSLNNFFYAGIIRIWLPFSERLLNDAKQVDRTHGDDVAKQRLRRMGYTSPPAALNVAFSKRWHSPVAFTCEWLAQRQRPKIPMIKARTDTNPARVLANAYSAVFSEKRAAEPIQECARNEAPGKNYHV